MNYTCYGLALVSDLALPELLAADPRAAGSEPDVQIRLGQVADEGLPQGRQLGPYLWVTPRQLWLRVPRIARFLVSDGNLITIATEPAGDADSIRVFLLGSALGALLLQRGLLVLHGNAIRIGDRCMVCVGQSGVGKSTLAAGFLRRGYEILADDVTPVDADCRALPGFPRIKLWQDSAARLGIDTAALRRIRPELEKFNYPLTDRFTGQALPIRWVYVLGTHRLADTHFESIRGLERFTPLRNNTYRVRFLEGMALGREHLQLCGKLAGRVQLAQIMRPERGFELDALVERILADIAANP
ncbi:hypothetical protein [uncultured Thiodictyon sp.]|uniref:hypothetical protein n=1 Tax=uncultured Thiodictyon sp. TaxID=1846217 RepID=UPI0026015F1F|nr:hypothetical protein [uncultured Thiodictyon sp.]